MKCKVTNLLLLVLVLLTVLIPSLTVIAKKPQYCEKQLDYYPRKGPGEIYLRGPITGDIGGYFVVYHTDTPDKTTGQVMHCTERWEIWENENTPDHILLEGTNTALVMLDPENPLEGKWWAQGKVVDVDEAFLEGRYADYKGSNWHSEGIFVFSST